MNYKDDSQYPSSSLLALFVAFTVFAHELAFQYRAAPPRAGLSETGDTSGLASSSSGFRSIPLPRSSEQGSEVKESEGERDFPEVSRHLQWGAFAGQGEDDLNNFERLVGAEVDIRAFFVGLGDPFPSDIAASLRAKGKTLLIFLESYRTSLEAINQGEWDDYLDNFAQAAKASGVEMIIAPFPEMNGNWDPWSGYGPDGKMINPPSRIIEAWQNIHDRFQDASNVKFAWAVNNISVPDIPQNDPSAYYPGDDYVDYVGVDGFNFGDPWQSFGSVFDQAIEKLLIYRKPIYIFSMANIAHPDKAAWIAEGLGAHVKGYPGLAGWVWFHQDGHDGNWTVDSDAASLEAFKAVIPD